jgi:sulfane dehydrogenase subunit SoxC
MSNRTAAEPRGQAGPKLERRLLLAGLVAAGSMRSSDLHADDAPEVPPDPTKEPGRPVGTPYGSPSSFATAARVLETTNASANTSWSYTPLERIVGNVTPSGLHYERHHGGIPTIDPDRHSLVIHGLVDTPRRFTMADLKRLPIVSRCHFIECSGNTLSEWRKPSAPSATKSHGLLSTSEWTGVAFSTLAREVGVTHAASWAVAEGSDAAVMTRSIPLDKLMNDAILAYGQNGEDIRPEQGFPLRLVLPGYEGNMNIKWLRRIELSDAPFMTREETSRYTDLRTNGIADQFNFVMSVKSVVTSPSGGMRLAGRGPVEISGLAWSGRGRITGVEVSTDGGASWQPAHLDTPPEPICTVRFRLPWTWDGRPARIQSRCTDETGMTQPTHDELVAANGVNYVYHYNAIQAWQVASSGEVTNVASF